MSWLELWEYVRPVLWIPLSLLWAWNMWHAVSYRRVYERLANKALRWEALKPAEPRPTRVEWPMSLYSAAYHANLLSETNKVVLAQWDDLDQRVRHAFDDSSPMPSNLSGCVLETIDAFNRVNSMLERHAPRQ